MAASKSKRRLAASATEARESGCVFGSGGSRIDRRQCAPWLRAEQLRAVALLVGALCGLRRGELLALDWADIDSAASTIHVQRSMDGPLEDQESRFVPVGSTLANELQEWRRIAKVGVPQVFRNEPSLTSISRRRRYIRCAASRGAALGSLVRDGHSKSFTGRHG